MCVLCLVSVGVCASVPRVTCCARVFGRMYRSRCAQPKPLVRCSPEGRVSSLYLDPSDSDCDAKTRISGYAPTSTFHPGKVDKREGGLLGAIYNKLITVRYCCYRDVNLPGVTGNPGAPL